MEEFIHSIDDDEAADQLWRAIKGRGASRYFKDTLHRLGMQQSWCDYLEEAQREFVIEWAQDNNVPFEDDLRKSHKQVLLPRGARRNAGDAPDATPELNFRALQAQKASSIVTKVRWAHNLGAVPY